MQPNRRKDDQDKWLSYLWKRYNYVFHLVGLVIMIAFTGGLVWAGVGEYDKRIATNTIDILDIIQKQENQQKVMDRMDYNIQNIGEKLGVRLLKKPGY